MTKFRKEFEINGYKLIIQESDEEPSEGLIVDIYKGEENVFTETIWWDDLEDENTYLKRA